MRVLRSRGWWLVLLVSAAAVAGFLSGDPGKDPAAERLAALIKQLGDDKFANREAASRDLEAVGEKALLALRKAAEAHTDLETRRRAEQLIQTILLASCKSKAIGLELTVIDAGEFHMGSPNAEPNRRPDEPQHKVRITRPFLLGKYEVTQDEYQQVMKTNPSWFAATGAGKDKVAGKETGRYPVEKVTWYDAVEFCNRLSQRDGYEPYYKLEDVKRQGERIYNARVTLVGGNGYRLPTEAEWEFACRAGTTTPFHFGVTSSGREANLKSLVGGGGYGAAARTVEVGLTTRVGSYPPNRLGLYDMHGNAAEWCWDWYDRDYANAPVNDPKGPDRGDHRVLRGGSWLVNDGSGRSASRLFYIPDESNYVTGFRVARTP